jgi:hypothetical protein
MGNAVSLQIFTKPAQAGFVCVDAVSTALSSLSSRARNDNNRKWQIIEGDRQL